MWKTYTGNSSVLNLKVLSISYGCFKIRARERRGMTKGEAGKRGKWVMTVRAVDVTWHRRSFRRNTCQIWQFQILKLFPVKLDYTFLLTFLCWSLGDREGLSVFLSLVSLDSAGDQEHSTKYSAFVQCNGHIESSFCFLVPAVLNEFLDG